MKGIALQARFNEKDNNANGKWPMNKGRAEFHNFCGRKSQNFKFSTFQKDESSGNKSDGSYNSRYGNIRGRGRKEKGDKSSVKCFKFQKYGHFARECSANKKEPRVYEVRVTIQKCDDENILLVMTTEGECISSMSQVSCKWLQKAGKEGCNWLPIYCNRLQAEENGMVTTKEVVHCHDQWYIDFECLTHMTERKIWFVTIKNSIKNNVKSVDDTTLAAEGSVTYRSREWMVNII